MKLKNLVFTAVFAAIICVVSPFTIPIGPVPLSIATLAVYIAASTISWKLGTAAVVVYLLIGAVGVPVFSGMTGGVQHFVGPTGGFLIGYVPCALITGLIVDRFETNRWMYPVAMVLGTAALYICGTAWFVFVTGATLGKALALCVIPFLIGDAAKICAASILSPTLRKTLKRHRVS